MPLYEYQCSACGHRCEVIQKFSDQPLMDCPACGKPALQKQISATGFQLKGSGWYVTDYSKKGKNKSADSGSEASAGKNENTKTGGEEKSAQPTGSKDKTGD